MSDLTRRTFFGDAERDFKLTPTLIVELERKTGVGIGGLFRRLVGREFRLIEITETIRLALVGGGASPGEADALVAAYVAERPLSESYPVALAVLERLWFGTPTEASNGPA